MLQQEGIFKGHTFSTNPDCVHALELHGRRNLQSVLEMYPAPASRVMCQLILAPDGRHYVSYFARIRFDDGFNSDGLTTYLIFGHAR